MVAEEGTKSLLIESEFEKKTTPQIHSTSDYYRLLGICSLLSFAVNFQYAFSCTYTNSAVHSFQKFLNESFLKDGYELTTSEYSFLWNVIVNVWFVGFFVGIWLSRWLTDRYGRKPAFLLGNGGNVVGSVMCWSAIISSEPYLLLIGRLFTSVATSVSYCALVFYLQEVAPSYRRGSTSCLNGNIYSVVAIFGITLGNDQLLGKNLYYYLGLAVIPATFSFIILFFMYETPKYLLSRGKVETAEKAIRFYHGSSADVPATLKSIQQDVVDMETSKASFRDLISERYLRNALWLSLAAIQNTVALWTILLSSTYYLEKTGLEHNVAQWSSTVMALAYFAGTTTGVFTVDRFGRRSLLLISNIANMSSLALYTLCAEVSIWVPYSKYGCLVMLAIFGYTYGAGVGPVARFIAAELVPLKYRSQLTAVVFAQNTVVNVITAFSCRPLFDLIGPFAFCVLYVLPSLFCTAYIWKYLPETKGKEMNEIIQALRKQ